MTILKNRYSEDLSIFKGLYVILWRLYPTTNPNNHFVLNGWKLNQSITFPGFIAEVIRNYPTELRVLTPMVFYHLRKWGVHDLVDFTMTMDIARPFAEKDRPLWRRK